MLVTILEITLVIILENLRIPENILGTFRALTLLSVTILERVLEILLERRRIVGLPLLTHISILPLPRLTGNFSNTKVKMVNRPK